MTTIATLAVKLIADAAGYSKAMDDAEKKTSTWSANVSKFTQSAGRGLETIGKTMLTGAAVIAGAALAGVTLALKSSIDEAMQAEKVQAQLNAVLKSTGGAAGVTADMVNKLADKYSNLTMFEDDAVIGGENILLTFTNIGKDVFPLATSTMLDMSQALGTDLQSSAIQLGKALQDPIQGITALSRVGVNFSDEQKKVIESLVKTGQLEKAQALILKELQTEFGGSAEAAGKTFAGSLAILGHKANNLKESIGMALMPSLQKMLDVFIKISNRPEVKEFLTGLIEKVGKAGELIANGFNMIAEKGLLGFFTTFEDGSSYVSGFLELMGMSESSANEWGTKINEVATWIINGVDKIAKAFQNDKGLIVAVMTALGAVMAVTAWSIMAPLLPAIAVIAAIAAVAYLVYTAWTQNWGGIQEKTAAVWAWLKPVLDELWAWLSVNVPIAIQTMSDFWTNTLVPAVQSAWKIIQDVVGKGMTFIHNLTSGKLGAWSAIWKNTFDGIKSYIATVITSVKLIFQLFMAAMNGDWFKFGQTLRQIWENAWNGIKTWLGTTGENIKLVFTGLIDGIKNIWNNTDWNAVGAAVIQGIIDGVKSLLEGLYSTIQSVIDAINLILQGLSGAPAPSPAPGRDALRTAPGFAYPGAGSAGGAGTMRGGGIVLNNYGSITVEKGSNFEEELLGAWR